MQTLVSTYSLEQTQALLESLYKGEKVTYYKSLDSHYAYLEQQFIYLITITGLKAQ